MAIKVKEKNMNRIKTEKWLKERNIVLEEEFTFTLRKYAENYKKEQGIRRLEDVYRLFGMSRQNLAFWESTPCNTHAKKLKCQVVRNVAELFQLTEQEAEILANRAGLTLYSDGRFAELLQTILKEQAVKKSFCYQKANVSERMYQYIAKGRTPTKETALALSLSLNLGLEKIEILLKAAGYVLSKSLPNDMVIFYLISHKKECGNSLIFYVNEVLHELEMPLLMTKYCKPITVD